MLLHATGQADEAVNTLDCSAVEAEHTFRPQASYFFVGQVPRNLHMVQTFQLVNSLIPCVCVCVCVASWRLWTHGVSAFSIGNAYTTTPHAYHNNAYIYAFMAWESRKADEHRNMFSQLVCTYVMCHA